MTGQRILLIGIVVGLVALVAGFQAVPSAAPTGGAQPLPAKAATGAPGQPAGGLRIVAYYWLDFPAEQGAPPPFFQNLKDGINEVSPNTFVIKAKPATPATQPADRAQQIETRLQQTGAVTADISTHLSETYLTKGWRIVNVGGDVQQGVTFYLTQDK